MNHKLLLAAMFILGLVTAGVLGNFLIDKSEKKIFENNLKCADMQKAANEYVEYDKELYGGSIIQNIIFYSPEMNSCVQAYIHQDAWWDEGENKAHMSRKYVLRNIMSQEMIELKNFSSYQNDRDDVVVIDELNDWFNLRVEELKALK